MVILVIICGLAILLPTYRNLPYYLSLHKAYLAGFMLFYLLSYYRELLVGNQLIDDISSQITISTILFCGLFSYLFSHMIANLVYLGWGDRLIRINSKRELAHDRNNKNYHLIIGSFIAILLLFLLEQAVGSNSNIWRNFGTLVFVFATILYWQFSSLTKLSKTNKILIFLTFVICVLLVSRFIVLYLFIPFVLYRITLDKKKLSIWLGIFFVFMILILGSVSKTISIVEQYDIKGFYLMSEYFWLQVFLRIVTVDFLDTYSNLILIVRAYPNEVNYMYGETLIGPLVNFIPRSVWPQKPEAFGYIIGQQFYPEMIGLSLAPSFLGELWANFSFFGVITGSMICGVINNHIDFNLSRGSVKKIQTGVYLPFLVFILHRGDMLLLTVLMYSYLPLIFLTRAKL